MSYTSIEAVPGIVDSLRTHFNSGNLWKEIWQWFPILIFKKSGLTKDVKFRKEQLNNLIRFCQENTTAICQALWKDLRKHEMECDVGEISPIVDECKFMIKNLDSFVKPINTHKRFLMNAADKTFIRKEAKGVVLVMGKAHLYSMIYSYADLLS